VLEERGLFGERGRDGREAASWGRYVGRLGNGGDSVVLGKNRRGGENGSGPLKSEIPAVGNTKVSDYLVGGAREGRWLPERTKRGKGTR